jgi:general secretion pathway protein C
MPGGMRVARRPLHQCVCRRCVIHNAGASCWSQRWRSGRSSIARVLLAPPSGRADSVKRTLPSSTHGWRWNNECCKLWTSWRRRCRVVRASLGLAEKLRLIGVVLGDQRGVFAIIEDLASKQQSLYHLHDSVLDLGEVSDIRRNGIVIRQGNLEELLELAHAEAPPVAGDSAGTTSSPKKPSTSGAPLRKVVDRREVEQAMSDLPKLLSQARAVPNMTNGAVNGYRLDYIAPASFYEKIGVQTGDILQRVNGVDIRDPSTMLSLLQQLKNEQIVKLDVVRNNQRSTITYELR